MEDLNTHRSLLEGKAARAAVQNITHEELDKLRTLQQQMIELVAALRASEADQPE